MASLDCPKVGDQFFMQQDNNAKDTFPVVVCTVGRKYVYLKQYDPRQRAAFGNEFYLEKKPPSGATLGRPVYVDIRDRRTYQGLVWNSEEEFQADQRRFHLWRKIQQHAAAYGPTPLCTVAELFEIERLLKRAVHGPD